MIKEIPMSISALLQKIFVKSQDCLNKRLHRLVLHASESMCYSKQLSIVDIGRALKRKAGVKHNIKTIDRLFGNKKLRIGSIHYYQDCIHWLLGGNKRSIIWLVWLNPLRRLSFSTGINPCRWPCFTNFR